MPNYIPYSPWSDAANTMSGAGSGIAQVIAQQPEMALRRMQLQQQLMMMPQQQALAGQHAALFGAQTALAQAQAGKANEETKQLQGEGAEEQQLGNALSLMLQGNSDPKTISAVFQGFAHKAKTNPEQLAQSFSHMAAVVGSGMLHDQGIAQASLLGDKTYGHPVVAGAGTTVLTGNNPTPTYTMPGNVPAGGMRAPLMQYNGQSAPTAMGPTLSNPRPAGSFGNVFAAALKEGNSPLFGSGDPATEAVIRQVISAIPGALPGGSATNVPFAAPSQGAGGVQPTRVKVIGPDGRTGTIEEGDALPTGWRLVP